MEENKEKDLKINLEKIEEIKFKKDENEEDINEDEKPSLQLKKRPLIIATVTTIIILVLLSMIIGISKEISKNKILKSSYTLIEKNNTKIIENIKLKNKLPKFIKNKKFNIEKNTEEKVILSILTTESKDYKKLLKEVEKTYKYGKVVEEKDYVGYDKKGYEIKLHNYRYMNIIRIEIISPNKYPNIIWPIAELSKPIPKTKSNKGIVKTERENEVYIEIGETTQKEYEDYIKKCKNAGYNKKIIQSKNMYKAENEKGEKRTVEHVGIDKMIILITK